MRSPLPALGLALVALLARPAAAQPSVVFNAFGSGYTVPVDLQAAPGDPGHVYVVEKTGRIKVVSTAGGTPTVFVQLTAAQHGLAGSTDPNDERGLLGLAFHPGYAANGFFFVNYTVGTSSSPNTRRNRISRFTRSAADPLQADPASEVVMLEGDVGVAGNTNHNAGGIAFGTDGFLYVTMGDGGSGSDPLETGQNPADLRGSVLRLAVDGAGNALDCAAARPGAARIPASNPFVGVANTCDELFAYGFRNPWRLSVDPATGRVWVGDVGQGEWEEVDTVAAGRNYGWDDMEGTHCFEPSSGCLVTGRTLPVHEYSSGGAGSGNCSVTGGYVYRGAEIAGLAGRYVYGDYCSGRVWALQLVAGGGTTNTLLGTVANPTSFGVDAAGALYVLQSNGAILRIDASPVGAEDGPGAAPLALALAGPNPARGETALRFAAAAGGPARLALLDVLGREVAVLFAGPLAPGETRTAVVDTRRLAPGLYVARLATPDGARTARLVVAR